MRWQEELTSRGCLPPPERAYTPVLGFASFDPGQLALLQRSDSKLLSAVAAAQARVANSLTPTPQGVTSISSNPSSIVGQLQQDSVTPQEQTATYVVQTTSKPQESESADMQQLAAAAAGAQGQSSVSKAAAVEIEHNDRDAAYQNAQLARLPSAKGHCLSSYPIASFGRPQSPMKHPSTPGDLLGGLPASKFLSVRPVSMQGQRPGTAAATAVAGEADAATVHEPQQSGDRSPQAGRSCLSIVLERSTQPPVKSAASTTQLGSTPESPESQDISADHPSSAVRSSGSLVTNDNSIHQPDPAAFVRRMQRSVSGLPAESMQHVIPERLLTSRQASALLSGIPPNMRTGKMRQRDACLQPADAPGIGHGMLYHFHLWLGRISFWRQYLPPVTLPSDEAFLKGLLVLCSLVFSEGPVKVGIYAWCKIAAASL